MCVCSYKEFFTDSLKLIQRVVEVEWTKKWKNRKTTRWVNSFFPITESWKAIVANKKVHRWAKKLYHPCFKDTLAEKISFQAWFVYPVHIILKPFIFLYLVLSDRRRKTNAWISWKYWYKGMGILLLSPSAVAIGSRAPCPVYITQPDMLVFLANK